MSLIALATLQAWYLELRTAQQALLTSRKPVTVKTGGGSEITYAQSDAAALSEQVRKLEMEIAAHPDNTQTGPRRRAIGIRHFGSR